METAGYSDMHWKNPSFGIAVFKIWPCLPLRNIGNLSPVILGFSQRLPKPQLLSPVSGSNALLTLGVQPMCKRKSLSCDVLEWRWRGLNALKHIQWEHLEGIKQAENASLSYGLQWSTTNYNFGFKHTPPPTLGTESTGLCGGRTNGTARAVMK